MEGALGSGTHKRLPHSEQKGVVVLTPFTVTWAQANDASSCHTGSPKGGTWGREQAEDRPSGQDSDRSNEAGEAKALLKMRGWQLSSERRHREEDPQRPPGSFAQTAAVGGAEFRCMNPDM